MPEIKIEYTEPMTPDKLIDSIDEFLNELMKMVPQDYYVDVKIVNKCPWMFSMIFPASKIFRGNLPPMKEPAE